MTNQYVNEIKEKIAAWKEFIQNELGTTQRKHASYAEIIAGADKNLTVTDISSIITKGMIKIGEFSHGASALLHTRERAEIDNLATYFAHLYTNETFSQQAETAPIIATPPHFPNKKFACVFHAKPINVIEFFYETQDEILTSLPDYFSLSLESGLYTVKAVNDLAENPLLKEALKQYGL